MSRAQRDAMLAVQALLRADPPHVWAASVLLEELCGGLGRPIARLLSRGRVGEARADVDAALTEGVA